MRLRFSLRGGDPQGGGGRARQEERAEHKGGRDQEHRDGRGVAGEQPGGGFQKFFHVESVFRPQSGLFLL